MSFTATNVNALATAAPRASRRTQRRASPVVAAQSGGKAAVGPESVKLAEQFGFSAVEEGLFGFKPFPELWVGRMAMLGFATGSTVELVTGKPTLQQLGVDTPSTEVLTVLGLFLGAATVFGTARTLFRLQSGDLTLADFKRYANFFGLDAENVAIAEALKRKKQGDFTAADSLAAIEETKASGLPADALLMAAQTSDVAAEPAASEAAAPAAAPVARMTAEQIEEAYSKEVELTNGRYAMLGFAALILGEAATGNGLVGQLETYGKMLGMLGPNSGFF